MAQPKRVKSITDYERGKYYCTVEWTYDGQNRPLRSDHTSARGQRIFYITYEGTDGITMPMTTAADNTGQVFSLSGMSAPRSLKGLNIVKTADERRMKVIR